MSEQNDYHRQGAWIELEPGVKKFGRHVDQLDRHAAWIEPPQDNIETFVDEVPTAHERLEAMMVRLKGEEVSTGEDI